MDQMNFTLPETLKLSHQLLLGLILYLIVWLHRQLSIVKVSQMCEGILPNKNLILRRRLSAITVVIWLNIWLQQVRWWIIWLDARKILIKKHSKGKNCHHQLQKGLVLAFHQLFLSLTKMYLEWSWWRCLWSLSFLLDLWKMKTSMTLYGPCNHGLRSHPALHWGMKCGNSMKRKKKVENFYNKGVWEGLLNYRHMDFNPKPKQHEFKKSLYWW